MIAIGLQVRPATFEDRQRISNLIFFESHVHRHLEWHEPLEWLGSPNFWVLEENGCLLAALACPLDSHGAGWIRFFAHSRQIEMKEAWSALWRTAQDAMIQQGGATVAVIARQTWINELLTSNGFRHRQDIVMLEWHPRFLSSNLPQSRADIRPMKIGDLPQVAALDAAAFPPLWRNSLAALSKALTQAQFATVIEDTHGLAAYQISTGNPFGSHLARLAVRPDAQGQGLGTALVQDVIRRLNWGSSARLTVNTQSDNAASLALYRKLGFLHTGEKYPILCFDILPKQEAP